MTKGQVLEAYEKGLRKINLDKTVINLTSKTVKFADKEYFIPAGATIIAETDENIARWLYMNEIIDNLVKTGEITPKEVIYCVRRNVKTA